MKLRRHQTLDAQGRQCSALIDPSLPSVSELGTDHRYDSERAGVHDKNVIAFMPCANAKPPVATSAATEAVIIKVFFKV
jgi:hypothetical protein